jgi:hypothetical protein
MIVDGSPRPDGRLYPRRTPGGGAIRTTPLFLIVTGLVAGCVQDVAQDEPTVTAPSPAVTATQPAEGDIAQGCQPGSELTAQGNAWEPPCLFSRSTEITVTNNDAVVHSFTIRGTDVDVDVKPGTTENVDVAGAVESGVESEFFCKYHPEMIGYLAVE